MKKSDREKRDLLIRTHYLLEKYEVENGIKIKKISVKRTGKGIDPDIFFEDGTSSMSIVKKNK